jgi:Protein of unknown function (DUF1822)
MTNIHSIVLDTPKLPLSSKAHNEAKQAIESISDPQLKNSLYASILAAYGLHRYFTFIGIDSEIKIEETVFIHLPELGNLECQIASLEQTQIELPPSQLPNRIGCIIFKFTEADTNIEDLAEVEIFGFTKATATMIDLSSLLTTDDLLVYLDEFEASLAPVSNPIIDRILQLIPTLSIDALIQKKAEILAKHEEWEVVTEFAIWLQDCLLYGGNTQQPAIGTRDKKDSEIKPTMDEKTNMEINELNILADEVMKLALLVSR